MIMGEDNLKSLQMEKLWGSLQNHEIYVYPRVSNGKSSDLKNHPKVHLIDAHSWNFFYFYSKKTLKKEEYPAIITFKSLEYIDHNNFTKKIVNNIFNSDSISWRALLKLSFYLTIDILRYWAFVYYPQ
jgi:hypothetical protein